MINRDNRKKLEIRFSDGSDVLVSLKLEGDKLEKYGTILSNLLPLMLSQEASPKNLPFHFSSKAEKKLDEEPQLFEVLRKQGDTLNNILKVIREFRNMDFSSKDVKKRYEERVGKPIQLSTVATYLMRFHDKGLLSRRKMGKEYIYQAAALLLKNE